MQLPCVSDPLLIHKQKGRSLRASRAHRQPHPPKASSKPAPSFLATRACVFCSGRQLVRRWRARIVVHDPRERKRHCSVRCPAHACLKFWLTSLQSARQRDWSWSALVQDIGYWLQLFYVMLAQKFPANKQRSSVTVANSSNTTAVFRGTRQPRYLNPCTSNKTEVCILVDSTLYIYCYTTFLLRLEGCRSEHHPCTLHF
jgi:hypothetical protein